MATHEMYRGDLPHYDNDMQTKAAQPRYVVLEEIAAIEKRLHVLFQVLEDKVRPLIPAESQSLGEVDGPAQTNNGLADTALCNALENVSNRIDALTVLANKIHL
jgi:hypothetical protein